MTLVPETSMTELADEVLEVVAGLSPRAQDVDDAVSAVLWELAERYPQAVVEDVAGRAFARLDTFEGVAA